MMIMLQNSGQPPSVSNANGSKRNEFSMKRSGGAPRMTKQHQHAANNTSPTERGMRRLSPNFAAPGINDVICARGKQALNHPGNRRFRAMITASLKEYSEASSDKIGKSMIVSKILDNVRQSSPDGGFVKQESGRWYEVGDHIAREKCGQSFRDLLHTQYKSSTKAKLVRRKKVQAQMGGEVKQMMESTSTNETASLNAEMMAQLQKDDSSDDQMQAMFNKVNSDLLAKIKRNTSPPMHDPDVAGSTMPGDHDFSSDDDDDVKKQAQV